MESSKDVEMERKLSSEEKEEKRNSLSLLSKAQKGRWKKLRRRAAEWNFGEDEKSDDETAFVGGRLSGITRQEDALEFRQLNSLHQIHKQQQQEQHEEQDKQMQKQGKDEGECYCFGPSIVARPPAGMAEEESSEWRLCEGVDHRDLLFNFLFRKYHDEATAATPKSKRKRKRSPNKNKEAEGGGVAANGVPTRAIPSWAILHNLALTSSVVVVHFAFTHNIKTNSRAKNHQSSQAHSTTDISIQSTNHIPSQDHTKPPASSQPNATLPSSNSFSLSNILSSFRTHSQFKLTMLPLRTRLFQGQKHPRSVSDILFYFDQIPHSKKQHQHHPRSWDQIILSPKQLERASYPQLERASYPQPERASYPQQIHNSCQQTTAPSKTTTTHNQTTTQHKERRPSIDYTQIWAHATNPTPPEHHDHEQHCISNLSNLDETTAITLIQTIALAPHQFRTQQQSTNHEKLPEENSDTTIILQGLPPELYITTPSITLSSSPLRQRYVYALDCEMVETSIGSELARVTLIRSTHTDDEHQQNIIDEPHEEEGYTVVFDTLVKPRRPILNYSTEYSGVDAKMLQNVTTRIEHVQLIMAFLLRQNDILVGHSLENDLRVLRLVHETIIDTAVLFRSQNGRTHALRHLSAVLLNKQIQRSAGHCSEEDAAASLALASRRRRFGNSFQLPQTNRCNVFELLSFAQRQRQFQQIKKTKSKDDHEQDGPIVCIGPSDWLLEHATGYGTSTHALTCESIRSSHTTKAIVAWLKCQRSKKTPSLIVANLIVDNDDKKTKTTKGGRRTKTNHQLVNDIMSESIQNAPTGTIFLFTFQYGYQQAAELTKRRKTLNDPRSTLRWTDDQEKEWMETMDACRMCDAVWIGK